MNDRGSLIDAARQRGEQVLRAGTGVGHNQCRETGNALARDVLNLVALLDAINQDAKWAAECLIAGGGEGGRSTAPADRALTYIERITERSGDV